MTLEAPNPGATPDPDVQRQTQQGGVTPPEQRLALQSGLPESLINPSSRSEIANLFSAVSTRYQTDLKDFLPPSVQPRIDFSTALAIMHAIETHAMAPGNKWEVRDLYFAHAASVAGLRTAGFANAQDSLRALLDGATGNIDSVMKRVIPEDADKFIKWVSKRVIANSRIGNVIKVRGILRYERTVETRFQQVVRLQQGILEDPGRTRAVLSLLNNPDGWGAVAGVDNSVLPPDTQRHLRRVSFFELEDLQTLKRLFDAAEYLLRSRATNEAQRILVETFSKNLQQAGIHAGTLAGGATSAFSETALLLILKTVGGIGGGLMLGANEVAHEVVNASEKIAKSWQKPNVVVSPSTRRPQVGRMETVDGEAVDETTRSHAVPSGSTFGTRPSPGQPGHSFRQPRPPNTTTRR